MILRKSTTVSIDVYGCSFDFLNSINTVDAIGSFLIEYLECSEVRKDLHHKFNPQGITAVWIISESSITIHTWPEENYFHIDIDCCKDYNPGVLLKDFYYYLIQFEDINYYSWRYFDRGSSNLNVRYGLGIYLFE